MKHETWKTQLVHDTLETPEFLAFEATLRESCLRELQHRRKHTLHKKALLAAALLLLAFTAAQLASHLMKKNIPKTTPHKTHNKKNRTPQKLPYQIHTSKTITATHIVHSSPLTPKIQSTTIPEHFIVQTPSKLPKLQDSTPSPRVLAFLLQLKEEPPSVRPLLLNDQQLLAHLPKTRCALIQHPNEKSELVIFDKKIADQLKLP